MSHKILLAALLFGVVAADPCFGQPGTLTMGMDGVAWEGANTSIGTQDRATAPMLFKEVNESDFVSVRTRISEQTMGNWSMAGVTVRQPGPLADTENWLASWSFRWDPTGTVQTFQGVTTIDGFEVSPPDPNPTEYNEDPPGMCCADLEFMRIDNLGGGVYQTYRGTAGPSGDVSPTAPDIMWTPHPGGTHTNANLGSGTLEVGVAAGAIGPLTDATAVFDWVQIITSSQTYTDQFNYNRDFDAEGVAPGAGTTGLEIWDGIHNAAAGGTNTVATIPSGPALQVNRDTGAITLASGVSGPVQMIGYTLNSATAGALNPTNWQSITDNWDFDSGSVGNYFDPDDTDGFGNGWLETSSTENQWAEATSSIFLGDGGLLDDGTNCDVCPLPIGTAGAWTKSIYEDVTGVVQLAGGGGLVDMVVEFVGNGGEPFARSDLDFMDGVDPKDWTIFIANHLGDFSGMSLAEAYQLGDLDGDLDSDFDDWNLFAQDYDEANGAGSFAALLAGNVPEPSTFALLLVAFLLLVDQRRSRSVA